MAMMKREAGGTVMTDMGVSITFVPGEATYVPDLPEVIVACRAAGAVDADLVVAEASKKATKKSAE